MIGIGGTITTLAAVAGHGARDRISSNFVLTLSEVKCILEKLALLDISRNGKYGLHRKNGYNKCRNHNP